MKKTLLVLLLLPLLILSACMNNHPSYLELPNVDIETCGDACENGDDFMQMIIDTKEDRMYDVYFQDQDDYEAVFLRQGEVVDRDALVRADKLNGVMAISPEYAYRPFDMSINSMNLFIGSCKDQDPCINLPYFMTDEMTLLHPSYGYDEHSGYYNFTIMENNEVYVKEMFQYEIKKEFINYEIINYSSRDSQYRYSIMDSGVLQTYIYDVVDGNYDYLYINTITYEYAYYSTNYGRIMIEYFNPKEQLAFRYSDVMNTFVVTSYYDFEDIVSLSFERYTYAVGINFHFMDGWDQITCGNEGSNSCDLTNEGIPVFDSYTVFHSNNSVFYNLIGATQFFDQDEFDCYTFPVELQTNHSLETLKDKLDNFMNLEDPSMILPFSNEDLLITIDEVLEYLNNQ